MKTVHYKIASLLVAAICVATVAKAQTDTLKLEDVIIVKEFEPTIQDAKRSTSLPSFLDTFMLPPSVRYDVVNKKIETNYNIQPIESAKMKGEPLSNLYRAYVRGGIGNYTNTLAEISLNGLRSREYAWSVFARNTASAGGIKNTPDNGFNKQYVALSGTKYLKKHTIETNINWNRKDYHLYGFDSTQFLPESITPYRQMYNIVGGDVRLKSFLRDSSALNHDIKIAYRFLDAFSGVSENFARLDGEITRFISKEQLLINTMVDYNLYKNRDTSYYNMLYGLSPQIISQGSKWRLSVGLSFYFEQLKNNGFFHFYPNAHFQYKVYQDYIIPYLGVTGKSFRNNLGSLSQTNPFVNAVLNLENSHETYNVYGGIRGAYSSKLSFNTMVSFARIANMALFVNDSNSLLNNVFAAVYDTGKVVTLSGEVTYVQSENLSLLLKGEYFTYNMNNMAQAWQRPDFKVAASAIYELKEKIIIKADIFAIGSRWAMIADSTGAENFGYGQYGKKLKPIFDMNLGVEYRYTNRLSAYIQFNNITANKNTEWNGYAMQRFNVIGGLTYRFWGEK